ncbi:7-carboxy-7-deazaguanine synthase QueE [Bacillus alveayuensis]|jgi:7-carboxy-7-deazaguanine synthase|uniref:7-carboxy-7-deazaguanine synthase n=1 Tax=Aeribacillus alveayuensis TaxID=279215 RepID=A0ABT9VMY9_9BACI|nr:7-carboxy-7-deazaguanine synthase QueE [Bacillus alveayuensis]MDQ0162245.1 7-carboxy-7-deazaguanine synthase [Bacillus alveayuensis]
MVTKRLIPVIEIFGPTIQGEGMLIGRKTMFVRTAGCDFSCSWCDSAFTWDGSSKKDIRLMSAEEIWCELKQIGGNTFSHVTISGGNPALFPQIGELIHFLHNHNILVGIETQGSRYQPWFLEVDDLTISPKPPSSNMKQDLEFLDDILKNLEEHNRLKHVNLKIVIFDEQDFHYAKKIYQKYSQIPFYLQVGNPLITEQNDAVLAQQLLKRYNWLINMVMHDEVLKDIRVLPQLHTLVWGNKRGV